MSEYAPLLIASDAEKARRFIWGLPAPMQRILVGHPDLTFAQAVDRARHLEELDGGMDVGVSGEPSKKARTESQASRACSSMAP